MDEPQKPIDWDANQDPARNYKLAYQWLSGYDPRIGVVVRERFAKDYADHAHTAQAPLTPAQFYSAMEMLRDIPIPLHNPPPSEFDFVGWLDRRLQRVEALLNIKDTDTPR